MAWTCLAGHRFRLAAALPRNDRGPSLPTGVSPSSDATPKLPRPRRGHELP